MQRRSDTIDTREVEKFSRMAHQWHDPAGPFKPLHAFNPVRIDYILRQCAAWFGTPPAGDSPVTGKRLLDVGCGGGLVAEPMARLGATVTGIDASEKNIGAASAHAASAGLDVRYECAASGDLADRKERYDVVLALEVVEHVSDVSAFMDDVCRLTAPGGLLFVATLNRTARSFLQAVVGAEYILRWLPRGTHDWRKFVPPYDLMRFCERGGLWTEDASGFSYNPLTRVWTCGKDMGVNYIVTASKPAERSATGRFLSDE